MTNGNKGRKRNRPVKATRAIEHARVFDVAQGYKNRREERLRQLGTFGPASPVRRIKP